MYHRDQIWSLKFQLKHFISWIGRRQRKMFPLTKRIDKIIVFFSFLYSLPISLLTPNLINCIIQILKVYFPPRLKLLTVSPGHRCSCIWIQFWWFLIFADKTNLDIKGGGTGRVAVVEGALGVEGSAVHDAEDDGETDHEEHLWWQVRNMKWKEFLKKFLKISKNSFNLVFICNLY